MLRLIFYLLLLLRLGEMSISRAKDEKGNKPNIILVVTDDQDITLQGLMPMVATQKLLGLQGATFTNAFTSSPICCPSRASILSGQYAHNHATRNNSRNGGCYGEFWQKVIEPRALPVQLQNNGYQTFFAGKYLNEYFTDKVPPGWSYFYGLHGNSRYYNYTLTENGNIVNYTDKYLTDLLSEKIGSFIKQQANEKPFFAMVSVPAPHQPFTAAPRHQDAFEGVKALRTPNFNVESGILDKHWLVQMGHEISSSGIQKIDTFFRQRWQSLLAVDELITNIVKHLELTEEIDNTYIVFTSDNGYHVGQFAQPFDKRQPYETDIRIPFLVRGPTILKKAVSNIPVALIDLYPTFLEWANIELPDYLDGVSFNQYINNIQMNKSYHRQILIEYWGEGTVNTYNPECPYCKSDKLNLCTLEAECHCQDSWNNTYSCVRHFAFSTDKIYCEFQDEENFVEAYDLSTDPYQIINLGYELLPSERALYSIALQNLTKCIGDSCRNTQF